MQKTAVVWAAAVSECVLLGTECATPVWRSESENERKGLGNVGGSKIDPGGEIEAGDEVSEIGSAPVTTRPCPQWIFEVHSQVLAAF